MPTILTLSSMIISFIVTLIIIPFWIRRTKKAGLVSKDLNKKEKYFASDLGGLCIISGFLVGILSYVAIKIFVYNLETNLTLLLAAISSILIATIIGLVDDILGWKIGLKARYKVILTFFIALPIMALNAGYSQMNFPFIGLVEFGLFYPLILVPIAIIGTSNGFNMLAGYNGLESGLGIMILSTLGFLSWKTNSSIAAIIAFCMVFALIAFYYYNKYPAKVFPGDTMTYSVGSLIAIVAILGNIEKYALILFIPYFIEFILKVRGKFKKESFAKVNRDGSLSRPYNKYFGLEHIMIDIIKRIKGRVQELEVVFGLHLFQLIFIIITLLYFFI